jgi:tetratricopeptide (TPR) repeat protein
VHYPVIVIAFAFSALLAAAQPGCSPDAIATVNRAAVLASEFDLSGAAAQLEAENAGACETARVAMLYARGLIAAQEAFRQGAPPESLAPARQAMAALDSVSKGRPGSAAVARLVLQAATAAAQSELDEMRLYLESAIQMESLQRAAGQPGAPLVSAAETAGDLWLQVHRYEDAWRAYFEARTQVGTTARVLAGIGRTAQRLQDMDTACAAFQQLLESWGARPTRPSQIAEAYAYIGGCAPLVR